MTNTIDRDISLGEWRELALCDGADTHMPRRPQESHKARTLRWAAAISICLDCPVLEACDRYADRTRPEYGVWGARIYDQTNRAIPAGATLEQVVLAEAGRLLPRGEQRQLAV